MGTARTATNSLPIMTLETKHLGRSELAGCTRIFRDLHFYHGLLGPGNHLHPAEMPV